ncbi:entericidin A/B family lipoprotein [Paenirhodobacter sp.]
MRKFLFPLLALAALSACETVKGAGQDIQSAGHAVSTEASRAQSKM